LLLPLPLLTVTVTVYTTVEKDDEDDGDDVNSAIELLWEQWEKEQADLEQQRAWREFLMTIGQVTLLTPR
jgi:hypothetical protein